METFFKSDFSAVRIHEDSTAAAMGAAAFTVANHVYFAPGQYLPHSTAGLELLGHELAHVVQQKQGRVRNPFGKGMAVVNDVGLEAEADRMGRMAARQAPAVQTLAAPAARLPVRGAPPGLRTRSAVQAKVRVGDVDYHWTYLWGSEAETLWQAVVSRLDIKLWQAVKPASKKVLSLEAMMSRREKAKQWIKPKLKEWVDAGATVSVVSARLGYWAQDRKYKDLDELATALVAEYMQHRNHVRETNLAKLKASDTKINADMVSLMKRLYAKVQNLIATSNHPNAPNLVASINEVQRTDGATGGLIPNPFASAWTWWKPWFSKVTTQLQNPTPGYHLNYTYFRIACYKVEAMVGGGARAFHYHDRSGKARTNAGQYRYNEFNMIEEHEFAQAARQNNVPIMSGPSATMARLLRVCEKIGATDDEIKALLWTAFIFHNQHFFSNRTLTHTFHEIFDVTAEFDINKRLKYNAMSYERYLNKSGV